MSWVTISKMYANFYRKRSLAGLSFSNVIEAIEFHGKALLRVGQFLKCHLDCLLSSE